MVFPVIGGDGKPTGYEIENSCQFNLDAHCEFTPSSGSGSTQFTMSAWIKNAGPGGVSEDGYIISGKDADNGLKFLSGSNNGKMQFIEYDGGDNAYYIRTNRLFRDPSAWFHVVLIYDAPDGTAGDRMRLYINGTRETSWAAEVQLPQNRANAGFTRNNVPIRVGANASGSNARFNGYLADVYFCDGQNYEPTEFGETNDNGVWIPKEADVSFGTNGFKLEFKQTGTSANSSGIGADTSGNDNHFSVSGLAATNITTDTPTNNFATLNSLNNFEGATLSEGNTKAVTPAGSQNGLVPATMGVKNGKWYWEVKVSTTQYVAVGIIADDKLHKAYLTDSNSSTRIVKGDDGTKHSSNSAGGNYMAAYEGSILQVALNLDDGEITFGAGGSWANGSGSTNQTFANSTAAYTDLNSSSDFTNKFILPVVSDENQGTSDTFEMNFGNPPFAISSGNSDANGYGNFEYAVPSGFYSLCTKNLAEYG